MKYTKGGINYPKMKIISYLKALYWIRYKSRLFSSWLNLVKHFNELESNNQESAFYYASTNYRISQTKAEGK
jgi:hypothetical protein